VITARLAELVFRNPAERRRLEQLLHPLVRRKLQEALASAPPGGVVVLDVPLLAEGGLAAECDIFLFVECSIRTRQQRAATRGWDGDELARRDAAQLSPDEKLATTAGKPLWRLANDGSMQDLEKVLEAAWNQIITTYPVTT